jgi:hypothetical protein
MRAAPPPLTTALLGLVVVAGCAAAGRYAPRAVLDGGFVGAQSTASPQTGTVVYRALIAKTLGSHCRMVPSDSTYFDRKVAACGAIPGVVAGVSRVLLEVEATPETLVPLATGRGVRWLDPPRPDTCWP